MIHYNQHCNSEIVVCILDEIDKCVPSSQQLLKNVSDQTLFKFSEKYPVVVSKDLDEMLMFAKAFFKAAIVVPTGIDILDTSVVNIELTDVFQVINLKNHVKDIVLHKATKLDLAQNVFYVNGFTEDAFEKSLGWQNKKFSLGHGAFFYPVNNEPTYDLNIKLIKQLVTPAAGLNWVAYLNKYGYDENTVVRFYDYSYLALECMREVVLRYNGGSYKDFIMKLGRSKFKFIGRDWDYGFASLYNDEEPDNWLHIVNTVKFDFVHINLLESIDVTSLVDNIPGTFINFSNIFSYYLTSAFYSLQTRVDAEKQILESLKDYDCYVGFVTRASDVYGVDPKLAGHISEFTNQEQMRLPTWYENN